LKSEIKTNRESARIQPFGFSESDLLHLTLARRESRKAKPCSAEVVRFQRPTRYRHAGSPLIGIVRANPIAAPAAPSKESMKTYGL